MVYEKGIILSEVDFYLDANVKSEEDATITSDFMNVVDLKKAMAYVVTITATDTAGNQTDETVNVTVKEIAPLPAEEVGPPSPATGE